MAKVSRVVLALFDDSGWAHRALDTLKAVGFVSDDIGILEPRPRRGRRGLSAHSSAHGRASVRPAALAQSSVGSIAEAFVSRGMPADHARHYEDEVRRGNSLLVVRIRGSAEVVEMILGRFGAYEIRPFSAQRTMGPEPGSRSASGSKVGSRYVGHAQAMHQIHSATDSSRGGYPAP